jgi:hypothetical protein
VLEGNKWPWFLREWRRDHAHKPHRRYLLAKQQHARASRMVCKVQEALNTADKANANEIEKLRDQLAKAKEDEKLTKQAKEDADRQRQYRDRSRKYPRGLNWLPRRRRPAFTPIDWKHGNEDQIPTYPGKEAYVMATRVGNELRAMETYGSTTYGLDSQILWYELYAEAPEALRNAIEDSELQADTFVASLYVTMSVSAAMVAGALWEWSRGEVDVKLWVASIVTLALLPVFHRGLLASIEEWAATVRALVNNGRKALVEKYDLRLPSSIKDEKRMWEALTGFIYYGGSPYYAKKLNEFRAQSPGISSSETDRGAKPRDADGVVDGDGLVTQLKELGQLHQKGLLSKEEFDAAKGRLLSMP